MLVGALAAASALTAASVPARAAVSPAGAAAVPPPAAQWPAQSRPVRSAQLARPALTPDQAASAQARTAGAKVLIDADTTPTEQTFANPDGSYTRLSTIAPTRARVGGAWVPLDATLAANPDGTVSPKAVNGKVVFSHGGTMPLVSETDPAGHRVDVSFPVSLPAPVLSGASATYPGVFPGVDLVVSALTNGGFSEVLVVKDAAAAANPALRHLHLGLSAPGLKVASDAGGSLTVTDPANGQPVFGASAPTVWDSTTAAPTGRSAPAFLAASDAHGPGRAAHVAPLGLTASAGGLDLTVGASALTGPAVRYPVYVDPSLSPTPNTQAWTFVAANFPDQPYWNGANSNPDHNGNLVARVGYDDYSSSPNHQTWSYFQIGNLTALQGTDITNAELQLSTPYYNGSPEADGASTVFTIYAQDTGGLGSGNDYNHLPRWLTPTDSASIGGSNQAPNINITDMVTQTVSQGSAVQTLAVYVASTSTTNDLTYRYLNPNPTIAITYWHYPTQPTNPTITVGGKTLACSTDPGAPTWVTKTDSGTVALSVTSTTADVGTALWANYYIGVNGGALNAYATASAHVTAQSGNNVLTVTGYPVSDGNVYSWNAHASNGTVDSDMKYGRPAACYFRVDATSPTENGVTSTSFPQQGGGMVAGQTGTFTLSGADAGIDPSGVNHYAYNLGTGFTGANTAQVAGTAASSPAGRWKLDEAACGSTAADSGGGNPATLTSMAACGTAVTDTAHATRTGYTFDGTASYLATSGPVLHTNADFSVSAWVYLTDTTGFNTAIAQAGTYASGFYLQNSPSDNRWALSFNNADVAGPTTVRALSTSPPQTKTWTQLTATYKASTGVATLYVDGQAQGTVTDTSAFDTSGSFLIGRSQYNAHVADFFHGSIADVQAYQRVLSPAEVAADYSTTPVTAIPPSWGTNTLWVAAVDDAGNQSQPVSYSFFTPAAPYTAGVTGDITNDGRPDLVTVDKAGNLRLYSDPKPSDINVAGTGPLQYGGTVLLPATSDPVWQEGTFAGALVAHGGSFTSKNVDDLMLLQNGHFYVYANTGNGTGWSTPTLVTKPSTCTVPAGFTYSTCANAGYSTSWSAVKELADVPPATASGRPGLVTVEENGGVWSVFYYAAAASGVGFASPVLVAVSSSAWDWGQVDDLVYAGDVTGDGLPDLLVREQNGAMKVFGNIEAGINADPATAAGSLAAAGAYPVDSYPFLTATQSTYWGKPAMWTVDSTGVLSAVPVVTGATPSLGTAVAVSNPGWGGDQLAVENAYTPYDNVGVRAGGTTFTSGTGFDLGNYAYSVQGLQTASTGSGTAGFTPGSAIGDTVDGYGVYTDDSFTTSASALGPDYVIAADDGFQFTWPGQTARADDNWVAQGQTIPFPIDYQPGPATRISLLGAATGVAQGGTGSATLTWSDGTQQAVALTFSDWALGGAPLQPPNAADQVVGITLPRAVDDGTSDSPPAGAELFEDTITVTPPSQSVQLASITLPTSTTVPGGSGTGGRIHIFALGSDPAPATATHHWSLADGTGTSAADSVAGLTAGFQGAADSATWATDATRGTVAAFDGATGCAVATGPGVDTTGSFTVSAWAKLSSTAHNAVAVAQDGTSDSGFYLGYSTGGGGTWTAYFMAADTTSPAWQGSISAPGATAGTWTHLVEVYDAVGHTAYLYVNGTLAGSATGITLWNATGPLTIGRDKYNGNVADFFPGEISDVQTFGTALNAAQVRTLS